MFKGNYISFAGYSIKQHDTVEYLGFQLDSKLRQSIGIKSPKENKCQTKISLLEKHMHRPKLSGNCNFLQKFSH